MACHRSQPERWRAFRFHSYVRHKPTINMEPTITIDASKLTAALAAAPEQVRTAARNALNDTAREFQKEMRSEIELSFVLKKGKSFLLQSVKIPKEGGFASKDHLEVRIQVDPTRDHLAKFEEGGDISSFLGKPHVAIPSRDIRTGKGGGVKAGTALSQFAPFAIASNVKKRTERLVGQKGSFFMKTRTGIPMLAQTTGKMGKFRKLWLFVERKRIKPMLHFQQVAERVIPGAWIKHAELAIDKALERAGLK